MEKVIIFGAGNLSSLVSYYVNKWRLADICAYVVDGEYVTSDTFLGKPVIDFDSVEDEFPHHSFRAFVAMGYQELNALNGKFNGFN